MRSLFAKRPIDPANGGERFRCTAPVRSEPDPGDNPYRRFADTELILRDRLAIDRTVLANERTFLAYCRTCLALILTGGGCIKFFDSRWSHIAGWALIGLGLVAAAIGIWRTVRMARNIGTVNVD